MLRICIFATLFHIIISVRAQTELDSLYRLATTQSFGNILISQPDGIILIGFGTNDNPFNSYGTIFSKIDFEGNVIFSTFTLDSNKYRQYRNLNAVLLDTFLYTTFVGSPPYQLLKFNIHTGEIESRRPLINQLGPESQLDNYSVVLLDSNTLLINSTVLNSSQKMVTQLSVYHILADSFSYHFNTYLNWNQIITKVIKSPTGYILGGYIRSGDPNDNEYVSRAVLVWLDDQFVEKKRYRSPQGDLEGLGHDIILNHDASIVATNLVGYQIDIGLGHGILIPVWRPTVYCVDNTGMRLWQTQMGHAHFGEWDCIFNALIPSNLNDGYIAAGSQINFDTSVYFSGADTNHLGEPLRFDALIAKVSNMGDSLWSRHYHTADFLFTNAHFFDIIPNPNGGYILTGDGNKRPLFPGEPGSYTWLLFVDEYGCAVPGCHEIVSSLDVTLPDPIRIYPNPASDNLYIYQQEDESIRYDIHNIKGQLIGQFEMSTGGSTYILDVSRYAPGEYFLMKSNTIGNSITEKWIKL